MNNALTIDTQTAYNIRDIKQRWCTSMACCTNNTQSGGTSTSSYITKTPAQFLNNQHRNSIKFTTITLPTFNLLSY